jgi:hypothetical protein
MAKGYLITILMNPDFAQSILKTDEKALEVWREMITRPRNKDRLRDKIEHAGQWGAAHRFDHISVW